MRKRPKTASEDLWFLRRYCFTKTYPASDLRCRYLRAKIVFKSSEIPTSETDFKDVDGMFLCRYPDENMPTHEAKLTSELDLCPHPERRVMIDTLDRLKDR